MWERQRGRRAYSIGAVLCSLAVLVPVVWGAAPSPRELPYADNVAWLGSDAQGELVRVNVETGQVDARLSMDGLSGSIEVAQGYGSVTAQVGDRIVGLDLANLAWGEPVAAEGEVFAADGRVYLLTREGTVHSYGPKDLDGRGEIDLGATAGRPVVAGGSLVVPTADGKVHVVEDGEVVGRFRAGSENSWLGVAMVGDEVAVLNADRGAVTTFDPEHPEAGSWEALDHELPSGGVQMAADQPKGALWAVSPETGELLRIDPEDGRTAAVEVASAGSQLVGPVTTGDLTYVVDVDAGELVRVDADELEVEERNPIEVTDPDAVELMVVSEWVVVNDRAGSQATVLGRDGEPMTINKYDEDGVAVAVDESELASDTGPPDRPAPEDREPPDDERPDPRTDPEPPPTTAPTTTAPEDPGVDPPGAVGGLSASTGDGRANLSWSAASGADDYEVTVEPAVGGQGTFTTGSTAYSLSNLTNGTTYTVTVAARNEGGSGPGQSTQATPGRAPTVGSVDAERTGDRQFTVTFSYDAGGRSLDSCAVVVDSSTHDADCSGGTGTVTGIAVDGYNTTYTFRAEVGTALGDNRATGSGTSAGRPLTVSGETARFDGTCTWNDDWGNGRPDTRPYFDGPSHGCPGQDDNPEPAGYVASGTGVRATCRTSGDEVTDDNETASSTWLQIEDHGYMNTLWFDGYQNSPEADLPAC